MNILDIIIAVIILLFALKGLRKGIIIEVVTLIAFVVGIYGAMHFSDFTAEHMVEYIEVNPKYLNTVAFILTFILLVILVNLIGRAVSKLVKAMNLGFFDKMGGFLFGAAKGVLLCSVLLMVLINLRWAGFLKEEVKKESMLYPYVEMTVPYLYQSFDLVKDFVKEKLPQEEEQKDESSKTQKEKQGESTIFL